MNEDDTFNILRRTPIAELDHIYKARFWEFYSNDDVYKSWLLRHGWTDTDFMAAGKEYELRQSGRNNQNSEKNIV